MGGGMESGMTNCYLSEDVDKRLLGGSRRALSGIKLRKTLRGSGCRPPFPTPLRRGFKARTMVKTSITEH